MLKPFANDLLKWYYKHKRDLPWRRTKDPYHIWVSEIMLQQTTVNAVIPFYDRWIKLFPTVKSLAKADIHDVLKAWQGLGYYARARNLHKAASIISSEHKGLVPKDPITIRLLPGFGPYTTGSVLSIAYDIPLTIIDANVRRVVMRLLAIEGIADTKQDKTVGEFLLKVLPQKNAGDFNQALMELGALICRSKEPLCILCPVRDYCQAYKLGKQEIIPTPKIKIIKDVEAVIGIIKHKNKYFIQKRPSKGLLADLWEFPGGKVDTGEDQLQALKRELKEEINLNVTKAKFLFLVVHFYTQFRVNLNVYACEYSIPPKTDTTHHWASLSKLYEYPMPSGSAKIVEKIKLLDKPST